MDLKEYKQMLSEKSDRLYEFIKKQKQLQRTFESFIKTIENEVEKAEEEIANINIELDDLEEILVGGNRE